jgi:hypothetical protein
VSSYKQYRLAKRNGEIVQQERWVTIETKSKHPFWKFWQWGNIEIITNYGEWKDIPFADVFDEVEN